ncbi:hypothetical protein ACFS3C_11835 [Azotobacter vinelandii]
MLKGIIRFYGPFQGVLTSYLEKKHPKRHRGTDSGWSAIHSGLDRFHAEPGPPMMQDLMRQYVEQSKKLYLNTQNMFGIFFRFYRQKQAERKMAMKAKADLHRQRTQGR